MMKTILTTTVPHLFQFIVLSPKTNETTTKQVRTSGVVNSTRWGDIETRHLIDIWATRYSSLKCKKRNFKDWEMIAKEVHKRCIMNGALGLGPRTGSQCKIRIKNMVAEYKRANNEYSGHYAKHSSAFLDMIEKVLTNQTSEDTTQLSDDIDETDVKEEDDIVVHFTPEVNVTSHVTQPRMQTVTQPRIQTVTQHVTQAVTPVVTSPNFISPSMVLTAFPNSYSNSTATMATNSISLSALHSNGVDTQPMESTSTIHNNHVPVSNTNHASVSNQKSHIPRKEFVAKPKLSRPYKVVKVQKRAVKEDEKLLAVVREFMEERRKREEELFDRLFQQQAETEKRYQEFTLNVIKEIGRLFRPDTSNNTT